MCATISLSHGRVGQHTQAYSCACVCLCTKYRTLCIPCTCMYVYVVPNDLMPGGGVRHRDGGGGTGNAECGPSKVLPLMK